MDHVPDVVGDPVTLTGRLESETADGSWVALPDQKIYFEFREPSHTTGFHVTVVPTAADGSYQVRVPAWSEGHWTALFNATTFQTEPSVFSRAEASTPDFHAVHRTQIGNFDAAPEPVAKGHEFIASGLLLRYEGNGWRGFATSSIDLEFSVDGKTGWKYVTFGSTDETGHLATNVVADRDGYWRARFIGGADHLSSVSATDYVDVKYRTSISSFNAAPEPVKKGATLTVSGKLNRYVSVWGPLGGKTVYIYFRPYGSATWSYMGVAGSDRYGKWSKGFKASRDGTWMAKYKGSDTYLPATSASDYVDVR